VSGEDSKALFELDRLLVQLRRWSVWLATLALVEIAFLHASSLVWLADDAYASFRYADNWARGLGLVFNPGERVEGITNPLWTLMLGLVHRCGADIERSATAGGVLAYLVGIPLLVVISRWASAKLPGSGSFVWFAAAVAVFDADWATFASGGLETSIFTTFVIAGYAAALVPERPLLAGFGSGLLMAVAGMLRPDGAIFAVPMSLAFAGRGRRRGLLAYALTCLPLLAGFDTWRRLYFGDWLPNTYYAKSAFSSWWSQGLIYFGYFAQRHLVLLCAAVGASVVVVPRAVCSRWAGGGDRVRQTDENRGQLVLALVVAWAMAAAYTLGVVRVGGDFMYARLLVPTLPFLAIAAEFALLLLMPQRPRFRAAIGGIAAAAAYFMHCPVGTDIAAHHGIVDERAYYVSGMAQAMEKRGMAIARCIDGFPVRAAIYGGELRLAYRAHYAYAIEAHAGLMDPVLAHRAVGKRQRVGHEKFAGAAYLVLEKRAHFATSGLYQELSDPNGFIPVVYADLCGAAVLLLHWDPEFVRFVRARGATVPDYPNYLDETVIPRLDLKSDSWALRQWQLAWRFYFAHVSDPARARVFEERLGPLATRH
jgi:hypothetical protein